jgi:hypothetical protein
MKLAFDVICVMLCVISVLGLLGYLMDRLVNDGSNKQNHGKSHS